MSRCRGKWEVCAVTPAWHCRLLLEPRPVGFSASLSPWRPQAPHRPTGPRLSPNPDAVCPAEMPGAASTRTLLRASADRRPHGFRHAVLGLHRNIQKLLSGEARQSFLASRRTLHAEWSSRGAQSQTRCPGRAHPTVGVAWAVEHASGNVGVKGQARNKFWHLDDKTRD